MAYSPLLLVRAFSVIGYYASADFCSAVRLPCGPSVALATRSRSPGVSSAASVHNRRIYASHLDGRGFAVSCPLVRCWRLISGFCPSTRTFDPCCLRTHSRGSPCIITSLHLHPVGQRTFTSKLLNMPSTQRRRWRGGRYACTITVFSPAITWGTEKEVSVTHLRKSCWRNSRPKLRCDDDRDYIHAVEEIRQVLQKTTRPTEPEPSARIPGLSAPRRKLNRTVKLHVSALRFRFVKTLKRRYCWRTSLSQSAAAAAHHSQGRRSRRLIMRLAA